MKRIARFALRGLQAVLNLKIDEWQVHVREEIKKHAPDDIAGYVDHEIDKLQTELNTVISSWLN